jgi:hypothetical protein
VIIKGIPFMGLATLEIPSLNPDLGKSFKIEKETLTFANLSS